MKNAKRLGEELMKQGIGIVSGGTDNHLLLLKTDSVDMTGKEASTLLESAHITCNKNMVPGDKRSPFVTSGVRIGTPAITTRGFKEEQMVILAECMANLLKNPEDDSILKKTQETVAQLCREFPIYNLAFFKKFGQF